MRLLLSYHRSPFPRLIFRNTSSSTLTTRSSVSSSITSSVPSTFDPETKDWPVTCTFDPKCTYAFLKSVEHKWQPLVCPPEPTVQSKDGKTAVNSGSSRKSDRKTTAGIKYVLSMFPYPSGSLHLGHVKVYTSSDIISRYLRLTGHETVTPLGFDAFGLPAENAAFQRNLNPDSWTQDNMREMVQQLNSLSLSAVYRQPSCDPGFYKWTQWLVTLLLHHQLMYRTKALVNWDPVDRTVLADDQVDSEGKSWRSGAVVEKRFLSQWFIKSSRFIGDLWHGKDVNRGSSGIHMANVHDVQRNFIGPIDGRIFYLRTASDDVVPVFTQDPQSLMGHNAVIDISPDHWMAATILDTRNRIINPFTGVTMDVKVSDNVQTNWKATVSSPSSSPSQTPELPAEMQAVLQADPSIGGYDCSSTYTDWLVSRQRYWGTPIPIIHCGDCGPVPVPLSDLPVLLPVVSDFQALTSHDKVDSSRNSETVTSKLQELAPSDWLSCCCPQCGSPDAKRETDTLDTFVDSSWYYLRYATNASHEKAFDEDFWSENRIFSYTGGPEHAIGHLMHSRLMFHFFRSIGLVRNPVSEPYDKFLLQGIINARTFKDRDSGAYLRPEEAQARLQNMTSKKEKESIVISFEKMSKSKHNGVNPLSLIRDFGSDATRLTVMGFGSSHKERNWRGTEQEFEETTSFLRKLLLTMDQFVFMKQVIAEEGKITAGKLVTAPVIRRFTVSKKPLAHDIVTQELQLLKQKRNTTARDVRFAFEHHFRIGSACRKIQGLNEFLRRNNLRREVGSSDEFQQSLGDMIIMMSSIVPSIAAELWSGFSAHVDQSLAQRYDLKNNVFKQNFPKMDEDFVNEIIIDYDNERYHFVDKEILNQGSEDVVTRAALKHLLETHILQDESQVAKVSVNFLPAVKAVVKVKSLAAQEEENESKDRRKEKKRKKRAKGEDSDDED